MRLEHAKFANVAFVNKIQGSRDAAIATAVKGKGQRRRSSRSLTEPRAQRAEQHTHHQMGQHAAHVENGGAMATTRCSRNSGIGEQEQCGDSRGEDRPVA